MEMVCGMVEKDDIREWQVDKYKDYKEKGRGACFARTRVQISF